MRRLALLLAMAACGGGGSARERASSETAERAPPERRDPELDQAVQTIRDRIADGSAPRPATDDKIVVELPASPLELVEVDDGSQLMQRVFRHVGLERDGSATDPAAKALDVHVDIDQWRTADGSSARHVDHYLTSHDGPDGTGEQHIARYLSSLAKSDPSFAIPSDRRIAYEHVVPTSGLKDTRPYTRTYLLMAQAGLTGSSVADAKVGYDPTSNRPLVQVELDRAGGLVFGELTARLVGKKLAIVVDGKVTSAPVINSAIRGGRLVIHMGGADPKEAERAAEKLANALRP